MPGTSQLLIHPIRDVTIVNFRDASILDALQVQQIGEELFELVDVKDRRKLILDFSEVKFLSSSALGVLVTLRKKSDAIKGQVLLCGMRPELRKIFKITNLEKLFQFFDNEERALNSLGLSTAG